MREISQTLTNDFSQTKKITASIFWQRSDFIFSYYIYKQNGPDPWDGRARIGQFLMELPLGEYIDTSVKNTLPCLQINRLTTN